MGGWPVGRSCIGRAAKKSLLNTDIRLASNCVKGASWQRAAEGDVWEGRTKQPSKASLIGSQFIGAQILVVISRISKDALDL